MKEVIILGAGMAGFGAAHHLRKAGRPSITFDRNPYYGGHAASFIHPGDWIFDDGPHISFTRVERMQKLFAESVNQEYEGFQAYVNNYWKGHWVKHPAPCNLHGLPEDLVVKIISEFARLGDLESSSISNYAEWLEARYGKTCAQTFPMAYGLKYHTTTADNMTTEWCGERLYRPTLEQVLHGALSSQTPDLHYINHFRYPTHKGFASYFNLFLQDTDLNLNHELVRLDPKGKKLYFKNGFTAEYENLISSIPLPALIKLIDGVPGEVRNAAARLACTTAIIVNLGINRANISPAHWTYFYDEEFVFTRLSFPHMFSSHTVPPGCGSIQAEIYFSDKYRPLVGSPSDYIPQTIRDLKRCRLLVDDDEILFSEATIARWAQVIFDLERPAALDIVHGYLREIGIEYCGRFGEWGYLWTDESFMSGERAAQSAIGATRGGV